MAYEEISKLPYTPMDRLDIILEKLKGLEKLDKLLQDTEQIKADQRKLQEDMETMSGIMGKLQTENEAQKKRIQLLEMKVDYMENQSRRCNLVFRGVDEKPKESWAESKDKIIEIINDLGVVVDNNDVERAHRTNSKYTPRPIVVKFYSYEMKERILDSAKSLKIKWPDVYIMEDFSKNVIEDRRKLVERMKEERKKGNYSQIRFNKLQIEEEIYMINRETGTLEHVGKRPKPEKKQTSKRGKTEGRNKRKRDVQTTPGSSPNQPNKIGRDEDNVEDDTSENAETYLTDEAEFDGTDKTSTKQ